MNGGYFKFLRMSGGLIADPHEFPWIVKINLLTKTNQPFGESHCGGSIIGKKWILTGNCIKF